MIYRISEQAFDLIDNSESIEGFKFNEYTVSSNSETLNKYGIDKRTILEFLKCDETVVYVDKDKNAIGEDFYQLFAHNAISNETIKIKGLGDHFVALTKTLEHATKTKQMLKNQATHTPILTHEFIKEINLATLKYREGEIGIGEYRTVDFKGRPIQVQLVEEIDGKQCKLKHINLEPSNDENIINKMNELLTWVNTTAFKGNDVMLDIAKFHSSFIKIHPFRDGNGRTCRLLTNYLLLVNGLPLINIAGAKRKDYIECLGCAISESKDQKITTDETFEEYINRTNPSFMHTFNKKYGERNQQTKYLPLKELFSSCKTTSLDLIDAILNYNGKGDCKKLEASQIE